MFGAYECSSQSSEEEIEDSNLGKRPREAIVDEDGGEIVDVASVPSAKQSEQHSSSDDEEEDLMAQAKANHTKRVRIAAF